MNAEDIYRKPETVLFLSVIAVAAVAVGATSILDDTNFNEQTAYQGQVEAVLYDDTGEVVSTYEGENLLTKEGANYFRSLATGQTDNPIDYVALSNADTYDKSVDNTYLEGEITDYNLSRTHAEIRHTNTGEWDIEAEWTATGEVEGVKAAGLFPHDVQGDTDDPANILIAEETMNDKVFREDYRFELTWTIQQVPG